MAKGLTSKPPQRRLPQSIRGGNINQQSLQAPQRVSPGVYRGANGQMMRPRGGMPPPQRNPVMRPPMPQPAPVQQMPAPAQQMPNFGFGTSGAGTRQIMPAPQAQGNWFQGAWDQQQRGGFVPNSSAQQATLAQPLSVPQGGLPQQNASSFAPQQLQYGTRNLAVPQQQMEQKEAPTLPPGYRSLF